MLNLRPLFRLRPLLYTGLAIAACSANSAWAQGNAANGATLYTQKMLIGGAQLSCQDCHGFAGTFRDSRFPGQNEAMLLTRINGAISSNQGMVMGSYSGWTAQQRSDVAAHMAVAVAPPPPPPFAPLPTPTAAPSAAMFSSTAVGATSAAITILLTNSAGTAITMGNPAVVPATGQISDFKSATVPAGQTACANGFVLQPGTSCSIAAQFAPTAAGTRTATWNVNFVGNVPTREVTLQGTAIGTGTTSPAPTSSANAPLNAGAGALGWINLLGLLAMLGVARLRRR